MKAKLNTHNNQALVNAIKEVTKEKDLMVSTSLPPQLYKQFKTTTLQKDTTVKNALIELITLYIDKNK